MRIGHLKEVTFEDVTTFAVVCVWVLILAIGKLLWLPVGLVVWAVKNLWWAGLLAGAIYGLWKLGDLIFCKWFALEY